jgi:protein O-mannosyl-transferase
MSRIKHDERSAPVRPLLLFVLLAFIAYYSILNSYFLSDDFAQIGKVLEGDWSLAWGREHGGFFRPLFILSYIVDARLWGARPTGYHLTNVLLHGLNSFLVYRLTLSLLRPQKLTDGGGQGIALVAGLLFLLHPSHTEAVSWISGRADLLAALFCLAALLACSHYLEKRRALYLLLSLFSFALALLSKESAASLPLILFALSFYFEAMTRPGKDAFLQALKTCALFFPLLFIFILVRRAALGAWLGGYGAGQHLNFSPGWIRDRFLQASLRALSPAFPAELSNILLKPLKSPVFILLALTCASLFILLLLRRRRLEDRAARNEQNGLVLLLIASFIFSLLPVINLRLSLFDTQGERFLYWPSAFVAILISYLSLILLRGRRWWLVLSFCLIIFYSVSLYRTNRLWREAAEVSRGISQELARGGAGGQSLIVINAPDNLRGVPVFHNGLEESLRVLQPEGRIEKALLLSLHSIQSLNDRVELKREGAVFSLRLTNRAQEFTRVADNPGCLEVTERSSDALRFRLRDCPQGLAFFFFSDGKMYRVLDGEGVSR